MAHFIEMTTGTVKAEKQVRLSVQGNTAVALADYLPGESANKVARISVLENGQAEFVGTVTDSGLLCGDVGFKGVAEKAKNRSMTCAECQNGPQPQSLDAALSVPAGDDVHALGWCEDIMNALCAASGAVSASSPASGSVPLLPAWAVRYYVA